MKFGGLRIAPRKNDYCSLQRRVLFSQVNLGNLKCNIGIA